MENKLNATTSDELKAEVKEFYDRTLLERKMCYSTASPEKTLFF